MRRYSKRRITQLLDAADKAETADAKGDYLESLIEYVFTKVTGVSLYARNILDGPRAHEIDLALYNEATRSQLTFLDPSSSSSASIQVVPPVAVTSAGSCASFRIAAPPRACL